MLAKPGVVFQACDRCVLQTLSCGSETPTSNWEGDPEDRFHTATTSSSHHAQSFKAQSIDKRHAAASLCSASRASSRSGTGTGTRLVALEVYKKLVLQPLSSVYSSYSAERGRVPHFNMGFSAPRCVCATRAWWAAGGYDLCKPHVPTTALCQ